MSTQGKTMAQFLCEKDLKQRARRAGKPLSEYPKWDEATQFARDHFEESAARVAHTQLPNERIER